MTESSADGPDWHLRFRFCSGLSLSPLWIYEAAPQWLSPMDSILEDKELTKMHVDLKKKNFPDIPCVPQMLGGPSLRRVETNEGLNIPSGIGCVGNNIG